MNQPPNNEPIPDVVDVTPVDAPLYCYVHPQRETLLRCNRCNRPICIECAQKTPTGYRCRECVHSQQKVYDTAKWVDYPAAILIATILSFAGSYIALYLGFFIIFLAPIAGFIIAEAVRWVTKRRRSMQLFRWVAVATALGSLPFLVFSLIGIFARLGLGTGFNISSLLGIAWQFLYTALITSSVYGRLGGIHIR
jgi:hypothetical protein